MVKERLVVSEEDISKMRKVLRENSDLREQLLNYVRETVGKDGINLIDNTLEAVVAVVLAAAYKEGVKVIMFEGEKYWLFTFMVSEKELDAHYDSQIRYG